MVKFRGAGRAWRWYCYRLILLVFLLGVLGGCGAPDADQTSAPSFALVASLAVGTPVYDIAWSADSTLLAVKSGRTVQVWDVNTNTPKLTYRGHDHEVSSAVFSPDSTFIMSIDAQGGIARWSPLTGNELWQGSTETGIKLEQAPGSLPLWYDIQLGADQSVVMTTNGRNVAIWDSVTGHLRKLLPEGWARLHPTDGTMMLLLSPDGVTTDNEQLALWDIRFDQPHQLITHGDIGSLRFSDTGDFVIFEDYTSATLTMWNVATAQVHWSLDRSSVHLIDFSSKDMYVAASNDLHNAVSIWTVKEGALVSELELGRGRTPLNAMEFSPDGEFLLTARGNGQDIFYNPKPDATLPIDVWRVHDGSRIQALSDHTDAVNVLAFSPDGTTLASGSSDGTIKLWRYQP
ncbi:MAG: hypothetical protein H0T53_15310 [Herpetosiphonaceae bacterium]|nr:hypothetical protein [Herpetosiphonaceae bacterium]